MTTSTALPEPVLRVGVTGARALDAAQVPRLRAEVAGLLRSLAAEARRHASAPPRLSLLSAVAEGADRLVAEVALDEGFALVCPLPFAAAEYEKDFAAPDSRAAFHALLARAEGRVLALDGGRGDDEALSYEAVGRLIARNCDLLIGIWNGHPGAGKGGTADTIRYAARLGPPVVWLHATDPDARPRWVEDMHDLRAGAPARAVETPLALYLERLLRPPPPPAHGGHHSLLHALGHRARIAWHGAARRLRRPPPASPLESFLRERPHPVWGPWRMHGWLMRSMASGRAAPWTPPRQPADTLAALWFGHYRPADERAGEYAARYRSSYVWVFVLAALSLAAAGLASAARELPGSEAIGTVVELASLALIGALVMTDGVAGWQRRAIEYRLLAELCRKQQVLAPLGWVVPRASAWATGEPAAEADTAPADDSAWVPWLFSAWLRGAPLPTGTLDAARIEAARSAALHDLVDDQIAYHEARAAQSSGAGRRLAKLGESVFLLLLVMVAAKLGLQLLPAEGAAGAVETWLAVLAVTGFILTAASACFVGIRAYAELELLAEQSEAMLKAMRQARRQIEEIDAAAPLASQALGTALVTVATLMLEDLDGWARLFRAKVVEA